ncbi:inactive histone-lysine N-methyltransferase 2E isoform X2 [Daphnia magna]|uniref:SET domain-containing protein n=1 Tax=Daphnia magna TaxID=35525 RepID=A0ABR0A6Z0_9CRUS|nr:inactive histone-lysine N-methyltransferase 2E isoform X2 [Daphnia magna]KAK4020878.1 hypothetical protein OUZ56_002820 [Daphnia magna]
MDVNEFSIRGDVDCRKPRLVHTSESSNHNGHVSTINLSYQIVLQDHNYGAPLPSHNNESPLYAVQCKQEPSDSHTSSVFPVSHSQRGGIKTLNPRPPSISPQTGRANKPNGVNSASTKRQRTISGNSNGIGPNSNVISPNLAGSRRPGIHETHKSHNNLPTPPLVPKGSPGFPPYAGDLNSHLYASISSEKTSIKEESRGPAITNGSSGLSNYLSGWYRGSGGNNTERVRSRSDMRDSFNDDDSNDGSLGNSPRMATETDHEGEETETANECEDEEDEQDDVDLGLLGGGRDLTNVDESVTRCICKFGHDDGYMICCDRCSVWQHVDCMNLDRNNIPDEFLCELCQPRRVDRARARAIQYRKRQEFRLATPPPSSSLDRALVTRRERSKDRTKNDDYIDVEKTSKKFQKNSTINNTGSKYTRGGAKGGSATADRNEKFQRAGKRVGQPKWRRKGNEKQEESAPRKRKMFRTKSSSDVIDVGGPSSSTTENSPSGGRNHPSGELLLQWIDHYEEAVTNHYSPELRARVAAVRPNGFGGELLSPPSSTPVYRLASKAGGYKTLVAANPIRCGSPVIECRGKYMLASQLRPYKSGDGPGLSGSGASALRPTPHIIFHHLLASSTDNTTPAVEMCVDGRSYGNEARFVWQSCQPNAEIKHKVEKGSVHLFLVAKTDILESEEITVVHDVKNPLPCPYEGCPHMRNKDSGARTGLSQATNPLSVLSPVEADRKRRRRRTDSTANDPSSSAAIGAVNVTPESSIATPVASVPNAQTSVPAPPPMPCALPPTPVKRQQRTPSKVSVVVTEGEDSQDDSINPHDETDGQGSMDNESSSKKKPLSREERKMEAIMKAFERMEKAQQRRQESIAKTTHRKDPRDDKDEPGDEVDSPPPSHGSGNTGVIEKRVMVVQEARNKTFRRGLCRKRGGRMRRSSSGASVNESSRIRMRALSGEVHSGHSATEEESEHGGSSSSPGQPNPGTPSDDPSTMAFKCPKTKKVVFNNWSGDGSELNGNKGDSNDLLGGSNSLSLSVPVCYMRNPNPRSPTRPLRTAHLRPSTLASLKSSAGSASPDPHGEGGHSNDENSWTAPLPGSGGPGGSAKKRWLRQAISEETETESPTSGGCLGIGGFGSGGTVPANEVLDHVTPLKKRRLARASLSSETSFTPPSTPTPSNVGVTGSSENVSNESGLQPLMEKEAESLSAENSRGTPPEFDDGLSEGNQAQQQQSGGHSNEASDPPTPPLPPAIEMAKAIVGLSSPTNGYVSESSQQIWASQSEEHVQVPPEANVVAFASVDEHVSAAAALTQFHEGGLFISSSRPTWEFRAPDAQFMRGRNPSDVPDAVTTDVIQEVIREEKPKPVKRKLSILEYRQRKQIAFSDCIDAPTKEEPNGNETSTLKVQRDSMVEENSDSNPAMLTRTKDPPILAADDSHSKSESTADDSNTNSSYEADEETPTSI